jgi:hypothetical protein
MEQLLRAVCLWCFVTFMRADDITSRGRPRQLIVVSQTPGPSHRWVDLTDPGTPSGQVAFGQNPASQKLPDLQAKRCPRHGMPSIMAVLNQVVFIREALAGERYDLVDIY